MSRARGILCGSGEKTLKMWDAATGQESTAIAPKPPPANEPRAGEILGRGFVERLLGRLENPTRKDHE
jgi:hypothetical protein